MRGHHVLLVGAAPPPRPAGQGHRGPGPGRHVGLRRHRAVGALRLRRRAGLRQRPDRASARGATGWPPTARPPSAWPRRSTRLYHPELTTTGLARDLTLAARLINANLGTRVIGVSVGGWDTHSEPALRPRRAPRRARRRHRGVLHHPRARLPRPDHPRHLLGVRAPPRAQRQRRHRPRHRQRDVRRRRERARRPPRRPAVAHHLRRAGQLRARRSTSAPCTPPCSTGGSTATPPPCSAAPSSSSTCSPTCPAGPAPRPLPRRRPTPPSPSPTGPPSCASSTSTSCSSPRRPRRWRPGSASCRAARRRRST